ncbi:MAG TPA: hypothetical protein VFI08_13445 [Spirochaetia bacterium]|nr:hypothetical protein [Spirochaetia bacterium]
MTEGKWLRHYDRGLGSLARHRPVEAVRALQNALEECPPSRSRDLYQICLFLGVALQRVGFPQSAIKSWVSCQRLNKRGPTRKMLRRYTNCYGMERQGSSDADDWQAFSSIQIAHYLLGKNKRAFSTEAEQDMILDLIKDSWMDLHASGDLRRLSSCEKLAAFQSARIVFPTVVLSDRAADSSIIAVNFHTKQRVALNDRCSCGSGMAYMTCCGRTPGREELLSGSF